MKVMIVKEVMTGDVSAINFIWLRDNVLKVLKY